MKAEEILSLLGSYNGYLSVKDLSNKAGISRSAVWKHMTRLRSYGYDIESTHRRGFRLAGKTELPLPWELVKILKTSFVGKKKMIYYRHAILSTQKIAISLAAVNPNSQGIVIIAERAKEGPWKAEPQLAVTQGWDMAFRHLKANYAQFQDHIIALCCLRSQ